MADPSEDGVFWIVFAGEQLVATDRSLVGHIAKAAVFETEAEARRFKVSCGHHTAETVRAAWFADRM